MTPTETLAKFVALPKKHQATCRVSLFLSNAPNPEVCNIDTGIVDFRGYTREQIAKKQDIVYHYCTGNIRTLIDMGMLKEVKLSNNSYIFPSLELVEIAEIVEKTGTNTSKGDAGTHGKENTHSKNERTIHQG